MVYPKVSGMAAWSAANGTALCHWAQLYRYFVSQFSEFCRHNPLCCFSTSVYCCLFLYRLSPETFGYTLVEQRACAIHSYFYSTDKEEMLQF
jgi:hypothetical protein